ncbi:hypothetical protein BC332_00724 [Capsicum chinense]|nr:hypothetical protein BC332_00724 [Capsicum chinense]
MKKEKGKGGSDAGKGSADSRLRFADHGFAINGIAGDGNGGIMVVEDLDGAHEGELADKRARLKNRVRKLQVRSPPEEQGHIELNLPPQRFVSSLEDPATEVAHCFTLAELEEATKDFEKKVGSGGFGVVYYGKLKDGKEARVLK